MAEELHHAQDFLIQHDRESERAVNPFSGGAVGAGEVVVLNYIADPCRLTAGPNATGQPDAALKDSVPTFRLGLRNLSGWQMVDFHTAQRLLLPVYAPKDADVPIHVLTDCLEHFRRRPEQTFGHGPRVGHAVLRCQALLGSLSGRDVPGYFLRADDPTVAVADGRDCQGDVDPVTMFRDAHCFVVLDTLAAAKPL